MVSSAGLSAAYGGFQAGRQMDQQIQANDQKLQAADIEQQGNEALGRTIQAFQASIPGAQPMGGAPGSAPLAPPPGQPSVPRQDWTPQQIGPPPPQASMQQGAAPAPGMAAPQAAPAAGNPLEALKGRLDVKTLMGAIAQANPGAKPAVLAAAVNKALPLLTAQAQMDWKTQMAALGAARLDNAREGTAIRRDNTDSVIERREAQTEQGAQRVANQTTDVESRVGRREAQTSQGAQRLEQQAGREARLATQATIRNDQRWLQLEQAKQALAERIRSGQSREGLSQWRATLDAQHKRAMEIIQSNSINSNLRPEEKKALLDEQNKAYEDAIKNMKPGQQAPAPAEGGAKDQSSVMDRTIQVQTPEEALKLPPGTRYATPDGQVFSR